MNWEEWDEEKTFQIHITKPKIIVQSWLTWAGR
jgi:hypothetical protein